MERKSCSMHPDSKSSLKNENQIRKSSIISCDIITKKCIISQCAKNDKIQHHNSSLTDLQYSPSSTQMRWARVGEFFSSDNKSRKCSSMSSTIASHYKEITNYVVNITHIMKFNFEIFTIELSHFKFTKKKSF